MTSSDLTTSVIIPTYNRPQLLARAVHSALPQLVEGDEILVMDDGSTDQTAEVVKSLPGNIRYFRLDNGGPSRARNIGMQRANGGLLAFLDDDDEWLPHKLTLQRSVMRAYPDVSLSFTNFTGQFRDGRKLPNALLSWGQRERSWNRIFSASKPFSELGELTPDCADFLVYTGNIYTRQMYDDYVLPSTQMVRRTATTGICFPEDLRYCESWAFSSAMSAVGPAAYLDIDTIIQHDHEGPRLTGVDVLMQTASRITVLERQWGNDKTFLETHCRAYESRLDEERYLRIRELLATNHPAKAQRELKQLHSAPSALFQVLAALPRPAVQALNLLRRTLKAG